MRYSSKSSVKISVFIKIMKNVASIYLQLIDAKTNFNNEAGLCKTITETKLFTENITLTYSTITRGQLRSVKNITPKV